MKKLFIKLSICTLAVALLIASCKKSNNPSTHDKMVGTWKFHQQITDKNANNIIDAPDSTVSMDSLFLTIVFNTNGTATEYQSGFFQGTSTWSVSGNYLVTTDSGSTTPNGLLIVSGPGTTLTVADTSAHPRVWTVLNKQ